MLQITIIVSLRPDLRRGKVLLLLPLLLQERKVADQPVACRNLHR